MFHKTKKQGINPVPPLGTLPPMTASQGPSSTLIYGQPDPKEYAYRNKIQRTHIVEAFHLYGDNLETEWAEKARRLGLITFSDEKTSSIEQDEFGGLLARYYITVHNLYRTAKIEISGDSNQLQNYFIIKDSNGQLHICRVDIFNLMYEKI